MREWNPKDESLGSYFGKIYTRYSIDNEETWDDFVPDMIREARLFIETQSDFSSYISKKDWNALDNIDLSEFKSTLAVKLLQAAHQLKDEENYKQAIIEAHISLEVAISDFFKNRLSLSKHIRKSMETFGQLKTKPQLATISSLIGGLSEKDIENAVSVVEIRNKIVHDGFSPKNDFDTRKKLESMFTIIAKLISDKPIRFPSASTSNKLLAETKQKNS